MEMVVLTPVTAVASSAQQQVVVPCAWLCCNLEAMVARLIGCGVGGAAGGVREGGLVLEGCSTACLRVVLWGMLSLLAKLPGEACASEVVFFFFNFCSNPMFV